MIDLRGHGRSAPSPDGTIYTFDDLVFDIIEVLDYVKIKKSHFVGISLGSILIQKMLFNHQNRVEKIILGGAILNLNLQSKFLMLMGKLTQSILPFIWIYTFFAYVVMPYRKHRKSRALFIREAKKISQKEFKRWYKLTNKIFPLLEKINIFGNNVTRENVIRNQFEIDEGDIYNEILQKKSINNIKAIIFFCLKVNIFFEHNNFFSFF